MIYGIEDITKENETSYNKLFEDHFPEKAASVKEFIGVDRLLYYINAKDNDKLVGAMGILKPLGEVNVGEPRYANKTHYSFFHLVVHADYRNQGVATGIIRMAIKFLIDRGAVKIRNHKRENIIPHTVFKDLGFKLIEFNDEELDYKWIYELDVSKADINILNTFWSEYAIS